MGPGVVCGTISRINMDDIYRKINLRLRFVPEFTTVGGEVVVYGDNFYWDMYW